MSESSQSPTGRMFEILSALIRKGKPSSLDEITREVALPRPTVYRQLTILTQLRFLEKDHESRRYSLGLSFLSLSQRANASSWPSIGRRSIIEALVADIGETCNFVIRSGDKVLWLDRVETQDPVRLHLEPGLRAPLACTAAGKLFLSYMAETEIKKILEREPLKAYTEKTNTHLPSLLRELVTIRKTRLSIDRGGFIQDTTAVAVPVENASGGELIAALSAHGPSYRFSPTALQRMIPKLRDAAQRLKGDSLKGG
ncbi:MAG: IclR family transcriptional regulator [Betaproteobacteria bacterium]|nr:IclR family transcriptional regulator [Betaproteobacteria bacterium]NBT75577.1 IclR family transcriptional regulator [Betaproteobacteria bacterium]NCA15462.1 IclR family transcriptional regulator [Betaproteobacteria bacterium]